MSARRCGKPCGTSAQRQAPSAKKLKRIGRVKSTASTPAYRALLLRRRGKVEKLLIAVMGMLHESSAVHLVERGQGGRLLPHWLVCSKALYAHQPFRTHSNKDPRQGYTEQIHKESCDSSQLSELPDASPRPLYVRRLTWGAYSKFLDQIRGGSGIGSSPLGSP